MVVIHIIELYHHGTKGQRWGVRRFQNKDGSYTPAGIKRYQIGLNKIANKAVDRSQFINSRVIPKGTKYYEGKFAGESSYCSESIILKETIDVE